jgi:hypothetical protein
MGAREWARLAPMAHDRDRVAAREPHVGFLRRRGIAEACGARPSAQRHREAYDAWGEAGSRKMLFT